MHKDFDGWNLLKQQINQKPREEILPDGKTIGLYAHSREIWWFSTGVNVGSEIDGKNSLFERPGIVLKVHNKFTSTVIPISSDKPENYYSYNFTFNGIVQSAILSQAKLVDHKRLTRKIGTMDEVNFQNLKEKFIKYFQYETPLARGISEAEAISSISISTLQNLSSLSQAKRKHAEDILKKTNIEEILSKFGRVRVGGSFYTNLMTNNDIDIVVVSEDKYKSAKSFAEYLIQNRVFQKFEFGDFSKFKREKRPDDFIVVVKYEYGGEKWEIEIWFKDTLDTENVQLEEELLKIDESTRLKILEEKYNRDKSSDKFKLSSYEIYKKYIK